MRDSIQIMITMGVYMLVVIGIGFIFAKRANKSSESYFLGGRTLGPWVTAMSAEASDMSGWLLMGLPGVAYWCGIADAAMDGHRAGCRYIPELADYLKAPSLL